MQQAAPKPQPPPVCSERISLSRPEPQSCAFREDLRSLPTRDGGLPLAVPGVPPQHPAIVDRGQVIAGLRHIIHGIERRNVSSVQQKPIDPEWTLGVPVIDARLGGFDAAAVHEIKPLHPVSGRSSAGDRAAAFIFAWRLALRRLVGVRQLGGGQHSHILWCWPRSWVREFGELYGPGLGCEMIDPASLLLVETATAADALWVLEEALKSGSVVLAGAMLDEVALTPARRLSLAAASGKTPCLLLTSPRTQATAAALSRWRIGAAPSASHVFDPEAPGNPRWSATLERWRAGGLGAETLTMTLEWSDATHAFHMATGLGDRAACPPVSRPGSSLEAVRARR